MLRNHLDLISVAECPRLYNGGWCTHSGSEYSKKDCDGDGRLHGSELSRNSNFTQSIAKFQLELDGDGFLNTTDLIKAVQPIYTLLLSDYHPSLPEFIGGMNTLKFHYKGC